MRVDEEGNDCPETLGEYLALCKMIGMPGNKAVTLLEQKIQESPMGEEDKVILPDSQMRFLLFPLLIEEEMKT